MSLIRTPLWIQTLQCKTHLLGLLLLTIGATLIGCSPGTQQETSSPVLTPTSRIVLKDVDECSGIDWLDGAFYVHNDSGDDPILYRSTEVSFRPENSRRLLLENARAIDWEDITTLRGDLLIGDIGDNARKRPFLTLYRARYIPQGGEGELRLIARYPFQYPDASHDAEALLTISDTLYLVSKARGEHVTNVYRFDSLIDQDDLAPGTYNVPTLVAQLDIGEGEQVTAGCYNSTTETIVLLTYTHLLQYSPRRFSGAPRKRTLIAARQCEAICFHGHDLVMTNEQRDVFLMHDFLEHDLPECLPPRGRAVLPQLTHAAILDGTGESWLARGQRLNLQNTEPGEQISWALEDGRLLVAGTLHYQNEFNPSGPSQNREDDKAEENARLGSAVVFSFADTTSLALDGSEVFVAIGITPEQTPKVWFLDLLGSTVEFAPYPEADIMLDLGPEILRFEVSLPLGLKLRSIMQDTFLFDLHAIRLRPDDSVYFSGIDLFTINRPYTWGTVTVR